MHRKPALETQRNYRIPAHLPAQLQFEAVTLKEHGKNNLDFQQRQVFAKSLTSSAAEGEEGIVVPPFGTLDAESIWIESFRVLPEIGVPVSDILSNANCDPGWDAMAA